MSSININELQQYQKSREQLKYNYFEQVLRKCHHKMKSLASNFETQCFFEIPTFMLGIPSYNQKSCCEYVMNKLIQDGLKVLFINPNILFITWDIQHVKSREITQQNQNNNYKSINNSLNLNTPKKIEYKKTSSMIPSNNFIYDPKLMDLLKNKTDQI